MVRQCYLLHALRRMYHPLDTSMATYVRPGYQDWYSDRHPLTCFCTAAVWVSPIAFEVITFLMSIYKIWNHARENGDLSSNPLLRVLYCDGVLYFVVRPCFIQSAYPQSNSLTHLGYNGCVSTITSRHRFLNRMADSDLCSPGIRVFNLICWLIFPVSLMFVGVFILWALIIVMIDRLFLNLRNLHNCGEVDWEDIVYYGTGAEGDRRRPTPSAGPNRAQSTNIFRGGTIIRDSVLPTISPTRNICVIELHVTRTEERWSEPLDNRWSNPPPVPANAHALTHSPTYR